MQAKLDQLQVQVDRQNRQQVEADQDRQRDSLVLTAEVSTMRRVVIAAGLELPPPSVPDELCTVQQYADRHHLAEETVLSQIRRGAIEADKKGGRRWLILAPKCREG